MRETYPDSGFASGPVDFQVYTDGRLHVVVDVDVELEWTDEVVELEVEVDAFVVKVAVHARH